MTPTAINNFLKIWSPEPSLLIPNVAMLIPFIFFLVYSANIITKFVLIWWFKLFVPSSLQ